MTDRNVYTDQIEFLVAKIEHLQKAFNRADIKIQRWRGALVDVAQGRGDPVAVASRALELDNV